MDDTTIAESLEKKASPKYLKILGMVLASAFTISIPFADMTWAPAAKYVAGQLFPHTR